MSESTEYFWSEAFGSIYPTLRKLENQGLIIRNGIENTGKRKNILYDITVQGEEILNEWLKLDPEVQKPRSKLLLKLFFIRDQPPSRICRLLEKHRAQTEEKFAIFQLINTQLLKEEADNPALSYWLMTLRYGIIHTHASIDWCNECLETIKQEEVK